jgi:hypothetical protein
MKAARQPFIDQRKKYLVEMPAPERKPMVKAKLTISDRVRNAINEGKFTRESIHQATGLTFDQIGDALVVLLWDSKTVRIKRVGESKYFVPVAIAA